MKMQVEKKQQQYIHLSTKKLARYFWLQLQKLLTNFHQIWHVITALNAKQCALKLSISSDV